MMIGSTTSNVSPAPPVVAGHAIPQPQGPAQWLAVGRALLAELRAAHGIAPSAQTVAVGWTTVAGLTGRRFVGASRSIRETADLPQPVDHINAPRANAQFLDHAEQDVANAFVDAIEGLPGRPALDGESLRIFISHAKGPCSACAQGLRERQVDPGVLAQLSQRYPGLTIVVAWEGDGQQLRHLMIQDGVRLW